MMQSLSSSPLQFRSFQAQPTKSSCLRCSTTLQDSRITYPPEIYSSSNGSVTASHSESNGALLQKPSVQDYMEQAVELLKCADNGPPRWFCPLECGEPPKDAPVLFFLPGMDATGLGIILHHQSLGRLFEVRCLHIPTADRTPFLGLLEFIEATVKNEIKSRPSRPIYILGDSLGGCLALALAARNPSLDLVVILSNPATSFARSQLQPLFPLVDSIPSEAFQYMPYLFSFTMGDPVRMVSAKIPSSGGPYQRLQKLADALRDLLPTLPTLGYLLPKDALQWKLKLLKSGSLYANSRLHAVRAQVLILASGKDQMLPSADEAQRLKKILPNCKVRIYDDSGHTLLLEDGINLATIIKSTMSYRRTRVRDIVSDYIPPTEEEFNEIYDSGRILRQLISPVFFSTNVNNEIVKGFSGLPTDGPLLFVGNHMLMGLELSFFVGELYKERKRLLRGIAHPVLFEAALETAMSNSNMIDQFALFGAVPVSGRNLFNLLSRKEDVLLYPGGAREALHLKGEEHKLFWPKQAEFVRMAARHGAYIVPFCGVGEDDIMELLLDYKDIENNAFLRERTVFTTESIRPSTAGEVANQPLYMPILAPKVPGRVYFLVGKAISTRGREEELQDRQNAEKVYLEVKQEVEKAISYLLEKRKQDPYRDLLSRSIYESTWGRQAPTFQP